ncbi:MAG: sugar ABC transporter ATP-binding protein [Clostridia bacterium]|nr:sugar ABC transporter ATP-binding protein [Clostridia bacterium]
MSDNVLLRAHNIHKSFSGVQVLKGVDLEIRAGEVHALMGENGAGKSTLIKIIMGVYPKDSGEIWYRGEKVEIDSRSDAQRLGLAVIYQELSLIPTLSVMQNILLGQETQKAGLLDNRAMRARVKELMDRFDLHLDPNEIVENLSIAQQQTVEILKALTVDAPLIVMDEPTASLSASESERLFDIIDKLRDKGVGILYITHRLEEVRLLADRLTILRDGENVAVVEKQDYDPQKVIRMMIGKEITTAADRVEMHEPTGSVGLSVKGLTRRGVFQDISFDVHHGEILGIGGLVGSGRTEVLRAIFGVDRFDAGEILFEGKSIRPSVARNIRLGFGLIPEDRRGQGFIPLQSIRKNVALTNYDLLANGMGVINSGKEAQMCGEAIQNLAIRPNIPTMPVTNLSGGNQQKVVVGKWMARDLKVLLVDEPTAGIDVGVKEAIYQILEGLAAKGVLVIVVSSDLQELLRVSTRILVMRKGRIFKVFDSGTVTQEDVLAAASGIDNSSEVNGHE